MRSCKQVAARLSASLDEPLPLGERMSLRLHMMMCRYCSRYFKQIRALREISRGYEISDTQALDEQHRLSPEARERIRKALLDANGSDDP